MTDENLVISRDELSIPVLFLLPEVITREFKHVFSVQWLHTLAIDYHSSICTLSVCACVYIKYI